MVGLFLWIPQGWAATIHSVAAGGDWNKAETWIEPTQGSETGRIRPCVTCYNNTYNERVPVIQVVPKQHVSSSTKVF